MPTAAEKLERLETLLERIRARSRAADEPASALDAASSLTHPLRGTDRGIVAAQRPQPARLELPMPAPIPVSDAAPTHPLPVRPTAGPGHAAPIQTPWPVAARPLSSAPPRGPLATPLPPAMPGKPIPPTKSLLMGRPHPDSVPPPAVAARAPREAVVDLGHEGAAEEAPVAEHRVVRVSSGPTPPASPAPSSPAPSRPALSRPAPTAQRLEPAPAAAPVLPGPVVQLPPSMRADTAPASAARAMAIEAKRGRGSWWVASFVFLLFVAALVALRQFGLLPGAPP